MFKVNDEQTNIEIKDSMVLYLEFWLNFGCLIWHIKKFSTKPEGWALASDNNSESVLLNHGIIFSCVQVHVLQVAAEATTSSSCAPHEDLFVCWLTVSVQLQWLYSESEQVSVWVCEHRFLSLSSCGARWRETDLVTEQVLLPQTQHLGTELLIVWPLTHKLLAGRCSGTWRPFSAQFVKSRWSLCFVRPTV